MSAMRTLKSCQYSFVTGGFCDWLV